MIRERAAEELTETCLMIGRCRTDQCIGNSIRLRADIAGGPLDSYSALGWCGGGIVQPCSGECLLDRVGDALKRARLRIEACRGERPMDRVGDLITIELTSPEWSFGQPGCSEQTVENIQDSSFWGRKRQ